MVPHLIWLFNNDFVTIAYGFKRTGLDDIGLVGHIQNPLIFIFKQVGILVPFLFLVWLLIKKIKFKINLKDKKLLFLLFVNILPIFLMFITSLILGSKIRTMWMTPFYLGFGVLFIYLFQSQINLKKINPFYIVSFFYFFYLLSYMHLFHSLKMINELIILEKKWQLKFKLYGSKILYKKLNL